MTVRLSLAEQRALIQEASRAPSVHNIQPARWRFTDDGVMLFCARDRTLPVADPAGHDVDASLGAAFEGMAIALSARHLKLGTPTPDTSITTAAALSVCRASIDADVTHAAPDPLAPYVAKRHAYRGKFEPPRTDDLAALTHLRRDDLRVVSGESLLQIARLHDDATWHFESQPSYHRELWFWLRLSRSHPQYDLDGLNADCLALSALERTAASIALRPKIFQILSKAGVSRSLISESAQVRSAAGIVLFCPLRDQSPFDVGRRLYRLWLEVTALGLNLAPMSASADAPHVRGTIERTHTIPNDRRLANVFRVGRIAPAHVAHSPRLPLEALIV